jgi:hypothetical protein
LATVDPLGETLHFLPIVTAGRCWLEVAGEEPPLADILVVQARSIRMAEAPAAQAGRLKEDASR